MSQLRPEISIVIPHFRSPLLLRCLPSLFQTIGETSIEIIVVEDGGTSPVGEKARREFPQIRWVSVPKRVGFGGACNAGAARAKGSLLVFLNDDVQVDGHWLRELTATMERSSSIGVVGPKVRSLKEIDTFDYSGGSGGFIDGSGFPLTRGRIFGSVERDEGQYDDSRDVFWVAGCCLMTRSELFEDLGGFSEVFFMQMEEIDYCWRLQARGYRTRIVPSAQVYHYGGNSLPEGSLKKTYFNHRNSFLLLLRNLSYRDYGTALMMRILMELGMVVWGVVRIRQWRHAVAALGTMAWFLTHPHRLFPCVVGHRVSRRLNTYPGYLGISLVKEYFFKGNTTFEAVHLSHRGLRLNRNLRGILRSPLRGTLIRLPR